jgi:hypothetical protein
VVKVLVGQRGQVMGAIFSRDGIGIVVMVVKKYPFRRPAQRLNINTPPPQIPQMASGFHSHLVDACANMVVPPARTRTRTKNSRILQDSLEFPRNGKIGGFML